MNVGNHHVNWWILRLFDISMFIIKNQWLGVEYLKSLTLYGLGWRISNTKRIGGLRLNWYSQLIQLNWKMNMIQFLVFIIKPILSGCTEHRIMEPSKYWILKVVHFSLPLYIRSSNNFTMSPISSQTTQLSVSVPKE